MKQTVRRIVRAAAACAALTLLAGCDNNAGTTEEAATAATESSTTAESGTSTETGSTGSDAATTGTESATGNSTPIPGGGDGDPFKGKRYVASSSNSDCTLVFGTDGTVTSYYGINGADWAGGVFTYSYDADGKKLYCAVKGLYSWGSGNDTTLYTSADEFAEAICEEGDSDDTKALWKANCQLLYARVETLSYVETADGITLTAVYDSVKNTGANVLNSRGEGMEYFVLHEDGNMALAVTGRLLCTDNLSTNYFITAITDTALTARREVYDSTFTTVTYDPAITAVYTVDTSGSVPTMTLTFEGTTYTLTYYSESVTFTAATE